ncbi:MAG: aspartate kinase [Xanthomonadales bacterium]|nr:aspartate kinase [Xanthomonadales bacterium]
MADNWIVLKFGGTSVAGRRQWETVASLVGARRCEGYRVLLVCSAAAGVTNRLAALAADPGNGALPTEILDIHRTLGRDLAVDESAWLNEAVAYLQCSLEELQAEPGPKPTAGLLAVGEWLSTKIGAAFLAQSMETTWVDARDLLRVVDEPGRAPARRWLSAACEPGVDPQMGARWPDLFGGLASVIITQGFIARAPDGATALLGRGGSDTSAALLAGRLGAVRLEVWTDVPGLFSADPRLIEEARLLSAVDYDEALEMAASGAKVIQSRSLRAAAATGTPVLIQDVNRRDLSGTRIGKEGSAYQGVKTITCQQRMAVLLLENLDHRHQVGFLAEVFGIFSRRGLSVDLVATSETTTTVALNIEANHLPAEDLAALVAELSGRCRVKLFDDCVCVNLVGRGVRTALCRLQEVMSFFERRPLLMLSQSANDLCLSLLVESGDHEELLRAAHRALIPSGDETGGGVFAASWTRIRAL